MMFQPSFQRYAEGQPPHTRDTDSHEQVLQFRYLFLLPDYLPIRNGNTVTWEAEPDPTLRGFLMYITPSISPYVNKGHNLVSMCFYQMLDEGSQADEAELGRILLNRVFAAGNEQATPFDVAINKPAPQTRTIVEATTFCQATWDSASEVAENKPLRRCMDAVIEFYNSYRLAERALEPMLTYRRLHPRVIARWNKIGKKQLESYTKVLDLDTRDGSKAKNHLLNKGDTLNIIDLFKCRDAGDPATLFIERRCAAEVSLQAAGNTAIALIEAAIAAELLFDGVISMAMWEEKLRGEITVPKAASILRKPVSTRLVQAYGSRLGGSWSLDQAPLRDWQEKIAWVRNAVVHQGTYPSETKAADAIACLDGLLTFIVERLEANEQKYPRTAICYFDAQSRIEGNYSQVLLRPLKQGESTKVEWLQEYSQWREQLTEASKQIQKEKRARGRSSGNRRPTGQSS